VGTSSEDVIATILGSCIACCVHDPVARVGGMNHFLLPEGSAAGPSAASFGCHAMELLVNALARKGAARHRISAKVFGGASVLRGLSDAGEQNIRFVSTFLRSEGIPCHGYSVDGERARRIEFWPSEGWVRPVLLASAGPERATVNAVPLRSGPDIELSGGGSPLGADVQLPSRVCPGDRRGHCRVWQTDTIRHACGGLRPASAHN
jgi:chemotaxis protein CheD